MPRLKKAKTGTKIIQEFVTIISDLVMDAKDGFDLPPENQNQTTIQFGVPGIVVLNLNFTDSEGIEVKTHFPISRSGINFGVPKNWIPEIKKQLIDQSGFKFTKPFILLETGSCNGTSTDHYKTTDLLQLQTKIQSSNYLSKTLSNLLTNIEPEFTELEEPEYET
jgi:hypothetical protein